MILVLAEYGIYMNTTDSMAKIYLLQILQSALQTSEPQTCLVLKDENLVKLVTQFLVETCKSSGKDLLLVSHALDTFFDIYAENYYN